MTGGHGVTASFLLVDATGSTAGEDEMLLKKMVCILYVMFMPSSALDDTLRHVKDTFDWWAKSRDQAQLGPMPAIKARLLASTQAPRFAIEEE